MRLTRADLDGYRGRTLPDLVGTPTRLLFVGFNPGLRSVAVRAHFGGGSNRFYPALHAAGITDHRIDASAGFGPEDLRHLQERGIGITSLVGGATARADQLSGAELVAGAAALAARVAADPPAVVAILGITAYRSAFERPHAVLGPQADLLAGVPVRVVPNPSGLNRHASLADLAAAYREAAAAAGIEPFPPIG
ncbi:MAG TPA: mismatch-specific DNA-glycosylase [Marmoricola sp.]|nr:mismatch-specific DNA-glycosylase [Marmoricola sp.]